MRVLGRAIRNEPVVFSVAVGGSLAYSLLTVATAYVSGAVVGRVVVPSFASGQVRTGALAVGAVALLGVALGKTSGVFGRRLGAGSMQYRMQARYRRAVVRQYLRLPLSWHQANPTGTLLSNANADVEAAWQPIAPLPFAVGTVVMLFAAVTSLFATDWALAMVGVAVLPSLAALNVAYSRWVSPRARRAQALRAELSAVAHESFDGALVIKAMGQEDAETRRFAERAGQLRDAVIGVGRVRGLFDPMIDALPSLATLTALVVGVIRLRQHAVGVADVVSVAFLFGVMAFPVRAIGWVLAELPRSVAGWERIERVLEAEDTMPYGTGSVADHDVPQLRLTDVSFRYADGPTVLHEVSFTVPAGTVVALVGPTGSGKSTIASLAARLADPSSGSVELGGLAMPSLRMDSLVETVALVAQVPFVFDDTIRDNIAMDRDGIDDERIWWALRLARADGFVAALPHGLDTVVGERGASLSGGQRQRLTLARALAGRPKVLVLDDATSAVDPRVEAEILAALRGRGAAIEGTEAGAAAIDGTGTGTGTVATGPAASILLVAYRRATIAMADTVVYLDRGKVVALGDHEHLLATVPGYADLVTAYERAEAERDREDATRLAGETR